MLVGCNSEYADLLPLNKTRIKITLNLPSPITADKIMLWGSHPDGSSFSRLVRADEEITFIFNNGSVKLFAIAWTAPELGGDVYCNTSRLALTGPDISQNITLSNSDCDQPHFRGTGLNPTVPTTLGTVKTAFCESVSGISSASDDCTDFLESATRKEARGHAMSYRYVLKTFDKNKNNSYSFRSDEISSSCYNGIPTPGSDLSGLSDGFASQLPTGNGSTTPFYMTLKTYPGSATCDESTHGSASVTLPNGLISNSSTSKYFVDFLPSHKVYVRMTGTEICSTQRNSQTYAGGDGSRRSPYLICNETQFYNTLLNPTQSFKLLSDINLTPYYYGLTTLPNIPNGLTCLEKGSNFFPLGYNSGTCTESAETFATNDFDGGGKTIKGMNINMPSSENVGMFTRKYGGEIRRIKFENTYVKGLYYTGALVGHNKTIIRDIVMENVQVEGSSLVGGVAGTNTSHPNNCAFKNIKLEKARVSSATTNAGGFIGLSESCDFNQNSFSGIVTGATNDVGGIAGSFSNSDVRGVSFEGLVRGRSYVGGLAGSLFNTSIQDTKVVGGVYASHTAAGVNVGGLIGHTNGVPNVTSSFLVNSYFYGQVGHFCVAVPSSDCGAGNVVGDPGGWGAGEFTSAYYSLATTIGTGFSPVITGTPRTDSTFFNTAAPWPAAFTKTGDLPRLSFEVTAGITDMRHPCQKTPLAYTTVANQIAADKGNSANNPISICNYSQLEDMQDSVANASKFYKILSPIVSTSIFAPSASDFTGQLDGDKNYIVRMKTRGAIGLDAAWWRSIASTGVIKNLLLFDARIVDNGPAPTTSLLAKTNNGLIDSVSAIATLSMPLDSGEHSMFVHTNNGTIRNSFVGGSSVVTNRMAGVAFNNSGIIEDSRFKSLFTCTSGTNCYKVTGLTINNDGIIRRNEVNSTIEDATGTTGPSDFMFVSVFNSGLIEDIQINSNSSILSKGYAAHGIVRENSLTGTVRRVFNEGFVRVANATLPLIDPFVTFGEIDFIEGASAGIGYSFGGSVSNIAYTRIGRWSYPSQYGLVSRTPLASSCQFTLSGDLPNQWESGMTNPALFSRFGLMVTPNDAPSLQSIPAAVFPAANDTITVQDASPCSLIAGNPVMYFWPHDYRNGADLISNSQKFSFATFSGWSGVYDITSDDSAYHQYRYNEANGISSAKPVWLFDTTNSLRLNREY